MFSRLRFLPRGSDEFVFLSDMVVGGVLSLQEIPLGCSSRMPGNLNVFNGFSKCIKLDDLQDLTLPRHA